MYECILRVSYIQQILFYKDFIQIKKNVLKV